MKELEQAAIVEAAVQAVLKDVRRLGITWTIAYGTTIDSNTSASAWTVQMDGDTLTSPVDAVSLVGSAPVGTRVAVLSLSIGLNYVVGLVGANPLINSAAVSTAFGAGTTTSGSYSNMATSPLSFTKQVPNSRLRIDLSAGMFSTLVSTKVKVGVTVDGTDYDIINFFISLANTVVQVVGSDIISPGVAGSLSIQPIWLRVSGTGTLTTSSAEDISLVVTEVN